MHRYSFLIPWRIYVPVHLHGKVCTQTVYNSQCTLVHVMLLLNIPPFNNQVIYLLGRVHYKIFHLLQDGYIYTLFSHDHPLYYKP